MIIELQIDISLPTGTLLVFSITLNVITLTAAIKCVGKVQFVFKILEYIHLLLTGLVASQEETTTKRNTNFLSRKPNRNNRPKPKPRSTTPAPDEDEEVPTSPHCPEPDGFFADSEQCDKYYACRYGNCRSVISFFYTALTCWSLLQWHCSAQQTRFCPSSFFYALHFHILPVPVSLFIEKCSTRCWYSTLTTYSLHMIFSTFASELKCNFVFFCSNGRMEEKLCPDGML